VPGAWKDALVLLDEASMVDEQLFTDLMQTGAHVVATYDHGQLPPVSGVSMFTAYNADVTLQHIRRQAADSPIIRQAHAVRSGADYETDGDAFRVVSRPDAAELMKAGWPDIVLCWRNETRHKLNRFMRTCRQIAYDTTSQAGEPVMCLENHASGMQNGEVFFVHHYDQERGILLRDGPALFISEPWFEWLRSERRPHYAAWLALAYACTVHKAQGSEWPNVLVLDEFSGADRARWLYTAITRASSNVAIVRSK